MDKRKLRAFSSFSWS